MLVANLHCKATGEHRLHSLQEKPQTREELTNTLECALVEVRKLEEHRAEFVVKQVHPANELVKRRFTVNQNLLMRNHLGNLRSEDKIRWSLLVPTVHCRNARRPIERAIHFHGAKLSCVVGQEILRLHASRIKRAFPARRREGRSAEKNSRQRKRTVNP